MKCLTPIEHLEKFSINGALSLAMGSSWSSISISFFVYVKYAMILGEIIECIWAENVIGSHKSISAEIRPKFWYLQTQLSELENASY